MDSNMVPLRAIRAKCLDCVGGGYLEVKLCEREDCPLHPWRFGRPPASPRGHGLREAVKAGLADRA